MTLGLLLVLLALILSIISLFIDGPRHQLLAGAVVLVCIALLVGVQPLALT